LTAIAAPAVLHRDLRQARPAGASFSTSTARSCIATTAPLAANADCTAGAALAASTTVTAIAGPAPGNGVDDGSEAAAPAAAPATAASASPIRTAVAGATFAA
jgi:hypothetical protein